MSKNEPRRTRPTNVAPRRATRRRRSLPRRLHETWDRVLDWPLLWLGVALLVGSWTLLPSGFLGLRPPEGGDVARRDYTAPRTIRVVDVEATEAVRREERAAVLPVYDRVAEPERRTAHRLERIFEVGRQVSQGMQGAAAAQEGPERFEQARVQRIRQALRDEEIQPPEPAIVATLADRGFTRRLEEQLQALSEELYQRRLVADKRALLASRDTGISVRDLEAEEESVLLDLYEVVDFPAEARSLIEVRIRTVLEVEAAQRQQLTTFLLGSLAPNLRPNEVETERRREQAAGDVARVYAVIERGQMIVRSGDRIGATQAAAIAELDPRPRPASLLLPIAARVVLVGLIALVLWLAVSGERVQQRPRPRLFAELLLLLTVSLLGARFFLFAARAISEALEAAPFSLQGPYLYAIPFAALAMICQLLYGRQVTLMISVVFAIAIGLLFGDHGTWFFLYALAASLTALFAQEGIVVKQRSALVLTGLAVGGINVVMILLEAAVRHGPAEAMSGATLAFALGCGLLGGFLSAMIASILVPILEIVLSATTEIKLVELANTNLPLLQRLALEAPGTFQHSLMVANLAKAGCAAIGSDSVLAYTGGLYHDIGKAVRPEYFIENQRAGHNPHDKLSPAMSALVVMSHVKDGLEMGREHHLPRPVLDAIAQHHGTRRLAYFYDRACERADPREGGVRDEKYCYPGPKPQNKVTAVLMLADGIEAASRTLSDPSPAKLRSVIRAIMDACMAERQFEEADITINELRQVADAFSALLAHVYHRRLDYPGYEFERAERDRRVEVTASR